MKVSNIAKNTSYFTLALVIQKVITFSYFILLARNLIPEDLGKYYFAISFTTIFAIFIDLGLANVLTREVAKDQNAAGKLLSNVLAIKIPLAILSLLVLVSIINWLHYPELTKILVYISCISMILDSFTLTFFAVVRGCHNLAYESIAAVVFQIIVLIFGWLVIFHNLGLKWLMLALALASIFNFLYSLTIVSSRLKIKIWQPIDKKLMQTIITIAIPFALFGIFQRLYTYLDTVLLSVFAGDKYVGLYQVAFKFVFALQFLPMAFTASVYPAFADYWARNREQLAITFERAMNYLIIISLPISFGIISISDKIVLIFKPEYMAALPALNIIMIALIFLFVNYPIGSLLNACDRQKRNTINMAITLVISILLNLILIPKLQTLGASITVVVSNFIMLILGLTVIPKIIKYRPRKILAVFGKALVAALIMFAVVLFFKSYVNIFLLVGLGGV
ncbi:MAG: flippase, partial [Candidatus Falkowbacteria bacterium]|nr:flippase [Candidatus Falkowbacteria bacterium]